MNDSLIDKLESWDGVHVQYLKDIYESQRDHRDFFSHLMELYLAHPQYQKAITWLIKYHHEKGQTVDQEIVSTLYLLSNEVNDWETKLHLLQIMPDIFIPRDAYPQVEAFVRKCLEGSKPFVRAWAYQGLYEIAQYTPELIPELKNLCEYALEEESPSVKARVRKILEKL